MYILPFHVSPHRKFEEIFPPELNDFVYLTDGTYTREQLVHMEYVFLKALAFKMAAPTAHQFLHLFLSVHPVCVVTESLAMVSVHQQLRHPCLRTLSPLMFTFVFYFN